MLNVTLLRYISDEDIKLAICCRSRLTVYAKDGGLPPNVAKATVKIRVTDENDNAPVFGRLYYSIEVPENAEPSDLFTLRATDQDTGERGEMNYKLTGERGEMNYKLTGERGEINYKTNR